MGHVQTAPQTAKHRESTATLLLIAVFKLFKGILLLAVGVGALKLLHRDVSETLTHWVEILRVDPENRFVHAFLAHLLRISPNQLKALGVGTFIYSALLLTEGMGLLLHKLWAEYFTIITTAGLIPLEIYELTQHATATKIVVLSINVGIVLYLVIRVRHARAESKLRQR
ncbi:MAG: DUF2127 domain-containing protein [Bryobacteraceae bacterium]